MSKAADFKPVVDACTLCDMCFMTKCPYVPPHEFNLDFPHLMLRDRAVEHPARQGAVQARGADRPIATASWPRGGAAGQLGDRRANSLTRPVLEAVAGVHREAALPKYPRQDVRSPSQRAGRRRPNGAPAKGRKAALYATCFVNYNNPQIGEAAPGCPGPTASRPRSSIPAAAACRSSRDRRPRSRRRCAPARPRRHADAGVVVVDEAGGVEHRLAPMRRRVRVDLRAARRAARATKLVPWNFGRVACLADAGDRLQDRPGQRVACARSPSWRAARRRRPACRCGRSR